MFNTENVGVFLGLDVGKSAHHGHGLTPAGKKVFDRQLPNSELKLRAVFNKLAAKFGTVLVIVDQPASIGALPLTVAREAGCKVAYLPGLAMRRIADLYPGEAKTDAKDAAVIADAARTMPHTPRSLHLTDEITDELTVLVGFDQDLAAEATRTSNRIRGLLTQFHPSLERVVGPRLDHQAVTWLLERYGSPSALRKAGRRRLVELIRPTAPRMAARLIDDVFDALDEQTVVVPGTGTFDIVVPSLAASLAAVHTQRRAMEAQIQRPAGGPPSFPGPHPRCPASASGPPPSCWSPSATAPASPPPPTSPPTPDDEILRDLDPRRTRTPKRQPATQTRHVPVRLHLHERRSSLPHLLRPPASPRQNPHPSPPPPGPPTHQRPVRHPPRRHLLPTPPPSRTSNSPHDPIKPNQPKPNSDTLTKHIGAP
ncbi:transposase [Streptomyces zagrosensis]|uniref:Transposase n=1 Tax=Streptomyces zagrosensis TaxID=1042984 RepID=A0A7W9QF67_9ACTN|nr:transposase [Streptomyces zagrosensis]